MSYSIKRVIKEAYFPKPQHLTPYSQDIVKAGDIVAFYISMNDKQFFDDMNKGLDFSQANNQELLNQMWNSIKQLSEDPKPNLHYIKMQEYNEMKRGIVLSYVIPLWEDPNAFYSNLKNFKGIIVIGKMLKNINNVNELGRSITKHFDYIGKTQGAIHYFMNNAWKMMLTIVGSLWFILGLDEEDFFAGKYHYVGCANLGNESKYQFIDDKKDDKKDNKAFANIGIITFFLLTFAGFYNILKKRS